MDVISYYSTRKEKTSLISKEAKYFIYGLILGAWTIFCICELPELQEQQRIKVYAHEQAVVSELLMAEPEVATTETLQQLSNSPVGAEEADIMVVEETEELDPPKYTNPDLILLAQLIQAEGGIESYECKLCIGSVVLNRMTHDAFPDGLRDVIFQVSEDGVHQFSVTRVREDGTRAIDCEPSMESLDAAAELLTYGTKLPDDVVVFYTEKCNGKWVTTREKYAQVDHTIFAYAHKE